MDVASRALVEPLPDGIPDTFPARAAHFNVALATLYARASGRPSREAKAVDQQYLYPYEEGRLGFPNTVWYSWTTCASEVHTCDSV